MYYIRTLPNMTIFQAANLIFFGRFCKIVSIFFLLFFQKGLSTRQKTSSFRAIFISIITT